MCLYAGQSSIQLATWSSTGHGLAVVANYSLYYSDRQDWAMVLVKEREDNMVRVGVPDLLYQGKERVYTTARVQISTQTCKPGL